MPEDTCHGDRAVAPWGTKVEFKIVVLHIRISRNTSLEKCELDVTYLYGQEKMKVP